MKGERRMVRTLKMGWILLGAIVLVVCVMMVGAVLHVLDPGRWNPEEKSTLNVYEWLGFRIAPRDTILTKLAGHLPWKFLTTDVSYGRRSKRR